MDNAREMPIGFVFSLALNKDAMNYYSTLDNIVKNNIKSFIQNNSSGIEAKEKIDIAIKSLENNSIDFLKEQ